MSDEHSQPSLGGDEAPAPCPSERLAAVQALRERIDRLLLGVFTRQNGEGGN